MNEPSLFDSDTGATILKWAITILVAGFIAQFGKKFATFLIEKIRIIKSRKSAPPAGQSPQPGQDASAHEQAMARLQERKAELKANKKLMKSRAKERKKK